MRFDGAANWAPRNLSGVVGWYRADLGVTDVSGKASAWNNQVGGDANTHLAQGTAGLRPTINATDAAYNNQPTLSSSATIFMQSGTWATPLAQPFTWFVVGNDDGTSTSEYFLEGNISGASRSILGCNVIAGNQYSAYSGTELRTGTRGGSPRMVGATHDDAGTSSIFLDSMTGVTVGAGGIGTGNISGLTAFAAFSGAANLIGKLAEIIICSGVMSTGDRALLRTYFNTRYAMSITA